VKLNGSTFSGINYIKINFFIFSIKVYLHQHRYKVLLVALEAVQRAM
jgi:hypothetical protein